MTAIFIIHSSVLVELLIMCTHGRGLPGGSVVKNSPANAGDTRDAGTILGSGRSPGGGNGNSLQYSCLANPMDREAWRATAHKVTKSQKQLRRLSTAHSIAHFLNVCIPAEK